MAVRYRQDQNINVADPSLAAGQIALQPAGAEDDPAAKALAQAPIFPSQITSTSSPLFSPQTTPSDITTVGVETENVFERIRRRGGASPKGGFGDIAVLPFGGGTEEEEGVSSILPFPNPIDDEFENEFGGVVPDLDSLDPSGRTDSSSPNFDPVAVAEKAASELFASSTVPTSSQIQTHAIRSGTTASDIYNAMLNFGKPEDLPFGLGDLFNNSAIGQMLNAITTAVVGPLADPEAITAAVGQQAKAEAREQVPNIGIDVGEPLASGDFEALSTEAEPSGFFTAGAAAEAAADATAFGGLGRGLSAKGGQISFMGMKK